jgi:hypothetical protein
MEYISEHTLDCTPSERVIVPVVSRVLTQLLQKNDELPLENKAEGTIFHARKPPSVSVEKYLERLAKYSPCSPQCFIVALIYIDRLLSRHPEFLLRSSNVHRLLITSLLLAAKSHEDCSYNNAFYARLGGLSIVELNSLELALLSLLDFELAVPPQTYLRYSSEFSRLHQMTLSGGFALTEQSHHHHHQAYISSPEQCRRVARVGSTAPSPVRACKVD